MTGALASDIVVAVIGAGTMGSGIAHVAARAGHPVALFDAQPAALARARAAIEKDLAFLVSKGRLADEDAKATLGRIRTVSTLAELAGSGLVVEAIVEDRDAKRALFRELEGIVTENAILASNTSSISITDIAAGLKHPGRVVGMHFFNPVPRMALVEVIDGLQTDPAVAETLLATSRAWGKTPVRAKSTPGFIVNRVARPYYGEAMRTLTERAAPPALLDALLRECGGFPMGPCELMDLIGLDVNLAVTTSTFHALGFDRRYAPSLIQQELVRSGRHGRKSGAGFFAYGEGAAAPEIPSELACAAPAAVTAPTNAGPLEPLLARMTANGVSVARLSLDDSAIHVGAARLALTDGRTATRRAAEEGTPHFVTLDLALDFEKTRRIAVARADQCSDAEYEGVVGALQAAGCVVSRVDDIAGMVVMRIVAMLANEAADVVTQGIASAADADTAMRLGTNYPIGPLAWADRLGAKLVAEVLDNLRAHFGEERYRVSPALQRRRWSGGTFHE
jgi:3-hydroxybutyryl-CoA dehydrogenase